MKKLILAIAVLGLVFTSCKKEDPVQPNTTNNNGGGTNLTSKSLYIAKTESLDAYFEMPALLVGTNIYSCSGTQPTDYMYTFDTETNYYVEFSVNTTGTTWVDVYAGDIKFDTQGNLVEISGNQLGSTGYSIQVQSCNQTVGDQLVLIN